MNTGFPFGFSSLQLLLSPLHREGVERVAGTSGDIILVYSHEPLCLRREWWSTGRKTWFCHLILRSLCGSGHWTRCQQQGHLSCQNNWQLPVSLDDKSLILGSVSVKTEDSPQHHSKEWVPGMLETLSVILWRDRMGTRHAGGIRKHSFPSSFIYLFSTLLHFRLRAGTYSPYSIQCSLDHFLSDLLFLFSFLTLWCPALDNLWVSLPPQSTLISHGISLHLSRVSFKCHISEAYSNQTPPLTWLLNLVK